MSQGVPVWRRMRPWAWRAGAALLVLALYVGAWNPLRPATVRHVAMPLLEAAAGDAQVRLVAGGDAVRVAGPAGERHASFRAPAGVRFLLPALFLAISFPRRFLWLGLWGAHLAAGAGALLVLAVAASSGTGWGAYHFWTEAGRDLFSLLVPLWMWLNARQGRFLPPPASSSPAEASPPASGSA